MNNTELRESLLAQAEKAFFQLLDQASALLDAVQVYTTQNPTKTRSDQLKLDQLNVAGVALGNLPGQLSIEIARWKKDEERVLSRLGVEIEILNELYATIEATMLFLIRENIPLGKFSLSVVKQAHVELMRCNRLL